MSKYRIKPRMTGWFNKKLVFDIIVKTMKFNDPSYGNGGGEWYETEEIYSTHDKEVEAVCILDTLRRYEDNGRTREGTQPEPPKGR